MPDPQALADSDYAQLAEFRYALRRFLNFSEQAAAGEQLTPQQHQAMLVIRGRPRGTTTIGILAQWLCLKHHTAVELAQRLEKAGLISREHSADDARVMLLGLTEEGEGRLERLTLSHRAELKLLGPKIIKLLSSLDPS